MLLQRSGKGGKKKVMCLTFVVSSAFLPSLMEDRKVTFCHFFSKLFSFPIPSILYFDSSFWYITLVVSFCGLWFSCEPGISTYQSFQVIKYSRVCAKACAALSFF